MHTKTAATLAAVATMGAAATAAAQSQSTCSFDPATATVTVTVNSRNAFLAADQPSGEIQLNNVACGAATVNNTDTILVNGGALGDTVSFSGSFVPGLTVEPTGESEIEIVFALGPGDDTVDRNLSQARDRLIMTSGGIDTGEDGDEDITIAGTERLVISGLGGDDLINASAYTGTPPGGLLDLDGGTGDDRLTGDGGRSRIFGGPGDDILFGGDGNDQLTGSDGNDILDGGPGNDIFDPDSSTAEGADLIRGGDGVDTLNTYKFRLGAVTVTVGNGLADDGAPGEGDEVDGDVENVRGGRADDVLVGNGRRNEIWGGRGNDEIYGGGRGDWLHGDDGNDILFGDDGNDQIDGGPGDDTVTGGAGTDSLEGNGGNDTIFNSDGEADSVVCGFGSDDAEDDPLDTLIGCEL